MLKIETPIGQDVESEEDDPPIHPFEDLGECVRCCPRGRGGLAIVPWPACAAFVGTDTTTTAATIVSPLETFPRASVPKHTQTPILPFLPI